MATETDPTAPPLERGPPATADGRLLLVVPVDPAPLVRSGRLKAAIRAMHELRLVYGCHVRREGEGR